MVVILTPIVLMVVGIPGSTFFHLGTAGFGILSTGTANGGGTNAYLGKGFCLHLAPFLASSFWTSMERLGHRSSAMPLAKAAWLVEGIGYEQ